MKVIQIGSELALVCIPGHYQEGIKINVNKCGFLLKFSFVEKIYVFSTVTSLIFSYA